VLIAVFLDRVLRLCAQTEREIVVQSVANTESALYMRLALATLLGPPLPADWHARNPFETAGVQVRHYVGELSGDDAAALPRGAWAYDRRTHELLYRPRYPIGLEIEGGGELLRFVLRRARGNELALVASAPFRWDP
jgi:hypothetical protein